MIQKPRSTRIGRRAFLSKLGKGTLAVAIFGPAACGDAGTATTASPVTTSPVTTSPATTSPATTTPATTSPATTSAVTTTAGQELALAWERVNLGFVSAYVLARGERAAVVDTGVAGSAADIEASLGLLGLGWGAVDHVILTHLHGDHVGSMTEVMDAAASATAHAGEADLLSIASPRAIESVADGDEVFGLRIVATPGHTAGHICVYDEEAALLVAGDALTGTGGGVGGAVPNFSDDMVAADASVRKLAALRIDTVLFGHGEPVIGGAGAQLAALAADL